MNIQQFAEQILRSQSLEDKLFFPVGGIESFADLPAPEITIPDKPGRSPAFSFKKNAKKTPFPNAADLQNLSARGIVLHFFANHELLAMELMALALLKFPDADPKFRLGIVQTIQEEQNHMRLYQKRMHDYGVEIGSVPVSRYFWDAISNMQSPMDYVTRMSLTFEQANLDFSLYYKKMFAELGDTETAAVLDQVYREEIGHVKYGVTWFNRWRDQTTSDWQAYTDSLEFPMTASRAKGIGFDRDGRIAAGLSKEFIDHLYVFQCSKGRPPVVYFFNPASEMEALFPEKSFTAPSAIKDVIQDLASLMMFVAQKDDIVIVDKKPSLDFLSSFKDAGVSLPQFSNWTEIANRTITRFEPWGRTKYSQKLISAHRGRIVEDDMGPTAPHLFSKRWWIEKLEDKTSAAFPTHILASMDDVYTEAARHLASSEIPLVLKAPYGSAGRNMIRIIRPGIDKNQSAWIASTLKTQKCLIGEPWVEKVSDLSVQIQVLDGGAKVLGVTRFLTDKRGQYIGHFLGKKFFNLQPEFHRDYHHFKFQETLEQTGKTVGSILHAEGYRGPAGIDAFTYKDGSNLLLRPFVEVNPRYTMGRIAFEIDKFIAHKAHALWLHIGVSSLQDFGWRDFKEAADDLSARFPSEKCNTPDQRAEFKSGVICTNNAEAAGVILSVLFIGEACDYAITELVPHLV